MLETILLYTTLSCQQTDTLLLRIKANKKLDDFIKVELIETVKESNPECDFYWDAND